MFFTSRSRGCLSDADLQSTLQRLPTISSQHVLMKLSVLRRPNTIFDTCVSFTFFSKHSVDLLVTKNGKKQVNNTNFRFLIVKLKYCRCHGNIDKYKQAFKIGFVYLQNSGHHIFFTVCMQQACNDAHKLILL